MTIWALLLLVSVFIIYFTAVAVAGRGRAYRVACQIVGTPAFPSAKVLQVVQVVDSRRERHLSSDCIKLLHAQMHKSDRGGWLKESRGAVPQTTDYSLKYPCLPWENVRGSLPRRSGTQVDRGHCDAVHEYMKQSDCGTSHQPPSRSAERSPGEDAEHHSIILLCVLLPGFIFDPMSSYLRVNAKVLSGWKSQS